MTLHAKSQPSRKFRCINRNRIQRANLFLSTLILELEGKPENTFYVESESGLFVNSWEMIFCPKCIIPIDRVETCTDWIQYCHRCDALIYVKIDRPANFSVASLQDMSCDR